MVIAFATDNVEILVGITGSYLGTGIQYFIPAALVLCSRKHIRSLDFDNDHKNKHASPFSHTGWAVAILIWAVICIGFCNC